MLIFLSDREKETLVAMVICGAERGALLRNTLLTVCGVSVCVCGCVYGNISSGAESIELPCCFQALHHLLHWLNFWLTFTFCFCLSFYVLERYRKSELIISASMNGNTLCCTPCTIHLSIQIILKAFELKILSREDEVQFQGLKLPLKSKLPLI